MNEHSDEPHSDPDMAFERPDDYGQDYYDEQEPGQEAEYAEALPEKPKSNLLINVAIFGGVAVFALVMAWVNFGSVLFPPKTTANTPQDANALLAPVASNATPGQPVVAPPAGGMPTPDATAAATPAVITPPDASATAITNPAAAAQPVPGTPNPAAPTDVAALSVTPNAAVTTPPAVNPVMPNSPVATDNTSPTAITAVASVPTTPAPLPTMPPTSMGSTVVTTTTTSPLPTAPVPDNGKIADLEKQNQDLTAKTTDQEAAIADLKSQLTDAQAKLADTQTKLAQAQNASTEAAAAPKPVKPKKIVKKAVPVHHVATAKPPAPLNRSSDVPASSGPSTGSTGYLGDTLPSPPPYWVLRSAADNSAWVAHPGDSQLYQVTVGDQLPGIGKIISIQQQAGAWVVVGTQGQIRQE